jgi:hypothetical protein
MNRIVIAATMLMLVSGAVLAQAQADKPAAAPAGAAKEEMKPAPQREITVVQGPGQSTVKEDARHCLEHGTNTDIIKCAEPYLPVKQKQM